MAGDHVDGGGCEQRACEPRGVGNLDAGVNDVVFLSSEEEAW